MASQEYDEEAKAAPATVSAESKAFGSGCVTS